MPELQHHFRVGRSNKDLDERLVPNGEYRDAQNIEIVTSEGSDVGSVQNVIGNQLKDGKTYNISTEALTLWGTGNSSEAKSIKELVLVIPSESMSSSLITGKLLFNLYFS